MKNEIVKARGRVWLWQSEAPGAWHFITIGKEKSLEIKKSYHWPRRGFGSIPVNVTIGATTWKTSVFPEKGGTYLLPIKKLIRDLEKVKLGATINFTIEVLN